MALQIFGSKASGGGAAVPLTDRGLWAASTAYAVNDVFTASGQRRVVKTAYTSGATYGATDTTNSVQTGESMDGTVTPATGYVPTYDATTGLYKPAAAGKYDNLRNLYNVQAGSFRNLHNAYARARVGSGQVSMLFCGDSTTYGANSASTKNGAALSNGFPTRLAALLAATASGLATQEGTVFFDASTNAYDSRLAIGTGASLFTGAGPDGVIYNPTTATTPTVFSYAAGTGKATVRLYYARENGSVVQTVSINGAAAVTAGYTAITGTGYGYADFTGLTNGAALTVSIQPPTVGWTQLVGVQTFDPAATSGVIMTNGGLTGQTSGYLASAVSGVTPLGVLLKAAKLAPDLVTYSTGINDANQSVSLATFKTNVTTFVTNARAALPGADILLVVPTPPVIDGGVRDALFATYVTGYYALADTLGLPLLDLNGRWVSHAASSALFQDTLHPTAQGYQDIAQAYLNALAPA